MERLSPETLSGRKRDFHIRPKLLDVVDSVSFNNTPGAFGVFDFSLANLPSPYSQISLELSVKGPSTDGQDILYSVLGRFLAKTESNVCPDVSITEDDELRLGQLETSTRWNRDKKTVTITIQNAVSPFSVNNGSENDTSDINLRVAVLLRGEWPNKGTISAVFKGRRQHFKFRRFTDDKLGQFPLGGAPNTPESVEVTRRNLVSWAAMVGDTTVLEIYRNALSQYPLQTPQGTKTKTPLIWAALSGYLDAVKFIIHNMDVVEYNHQDSTGRTALSWAAGNGHASIVRLLHPLVDPNLQDSNGLTPLSWAARNGQLKVVNTLLEHSKTEDQQLASDKTPLELAAQMGHEEVVRTLIEWRHTLWSVPKSEAQTKENTKLVEEEIATPIKLAIEHDHPDTVRTLIEARCKAAPTQDPEKDLDLKAWLSKFLHTTAIKGLVSVMGILVELGADVDYLEDGKTPLCTAAEYGHTKIMVLLLSKDAKVEYESPGKERAIFFAVKSGMEEATRLLLDLDVNIKGTNALSQSLEDVALEHPKILEMLLEKDKDGRLATNYTDLHTDIDKKFQAHAVDFTYDSGVYKPKSRVVSVDELLENEWVRNPDYPQVNTNSFKWFHLPANNMKWVEFLINQLHHNNRTTVYKVLKPDRWVKRQHHGSDKTPHSRFMEPLCQAFDLEQFSSSTKSCYDKNLVTFMPYLHWDRNVSVVKMKQIVDGEEDQTPQPDWTNDQKLVYHYTTKTDSPLHSLHVRRTLDQYYYHSFSNTDERDQDQTVQRYQRAQGYEKEKEVTVMVDQLWLWVLVGPSSEKADTIITCFPNRDVSNSKANSVIDPGGLTDPVRNVMRYMANEPQAVQSVYDLAGIIASRCSRTFIDSSRAEKCLQFPEIYENSIRKIMDEEAQLFKRFKNVVEESKSSEMLQGNGELGISFEISLLQEIKDIQDELSIIMMTFEEQKRVLVTMERIIHFMDRAPSSGNEIPTNITKKDRIHEPKPLKRTNSQASDRTDMECDESCLSDSESLSREEEDEINGNRRNENHPASEIWGTSHDLRYSSHPLRAVQQSIDKIKGIAQRAEKTYQALNFLVDLKQKQSNVVDAHFTRKQTEQSVLQAEWSNKMTAEAQKQGQAIMTFTIITIFFLPMSFLSAFFAINITEFRREEGGTLGLGYVSEIIFPISIVISGICIFIAFRGNGRGNKQRNAQNPKASSKDDKGGMSSIKTVASSLARLRKPSTLYEDNYSDKA